MMKQTKSRRDIDALAFFTATRHPSPLLAILRRR